MFCLHYHEFMGILLVQVQVLLNQFCRTEFVVLHPSYFILKLCI